MDMNEEIKSMNELGLHILSAIFHFDITFHYRQCFYSSISLCLSLSVHSLPLYCVFLTQPKATHQLK